VIDRLAAQAYARGLAAFDDREFNRAARAFRWSFWLSGRTDLLWKPGASRCPNATSYHIFARELRSLLEAKRAAWSCGEIEQPSYLRAIAPLPRVADLRDWRMFCLFSEYIYNDNRYVECDYKDHFHDSAINAGIAAQLFFTDRISYMQLKTENDRDVSDLLLLRERLAQARPNVVMFDANFIGGDIGLNREFLAEVKKSLGVKLVGFLGDAVGESWVSVADYWAPVADVIFHLAPGGAVERGSAFPQKLLCSAPPVNRRTFHPDNVRPIDISFLGSYTAHLPPFWLATAIEEAERLGLRFHIRGHKRTGDCPNIAEYGAIMCGSRMVLNLSSRDGITKAMTGRAWQALHSGAVLLEEDNEFTKYFFVPFVHYVPFSNARQLRHLIRFFKENDDWARQVGANAADFCASHYAETSTWGHILGKVQVV
jgi:hypothetical protein